LIITAGGFVEQRESKSARAWEGDVNIAVVEKGGAKEDVSER
jgi:hypothetical protein